MTSYPAITIWQPWATLIAEGFKPFEFRGWAAPKRLIGQRIAIHAGARPVRRAEVHELLLKLGGHRYEANGTGLVRHAEAIRLLESVALAPGRLPLSAVICLATLGRPIRDAEMAAEIGIPHFAGAVNDSDRKQHSKWGWPLTDIKRIVPSPARGAQGWWTWKDALDG